MKNLTAWIRFMFWKPEEPSLVDAVSKRTYIVHASKMRGRWVTHVVWLVFTHKTLWFTVSSNPSGVSCVPHGGRSTTPCGSFMPHIIISRVVPAQNKLRCYKENSSVKINSCIVGAPKICIYFTYFSMPRNMTPYILSAFQFGYDIRGESMSEMSSDAHRSKRSTWQRLPSPICSCGAPFCPGCHFRRPQDGLPITDARLCTPFHHGC